MARGGGSVVDAVVVGSGPNGLAAALILALAGLEVQVYEAAPTVGGGTRTVELAEPGFRYDICSAVHPMALASPFFCAFGLSRRVTMLQPDVAFAHPLDGGRAGLAWRDLHQTATDLGCDGKAWRSLIGPLAERWQAVARLALSDFRHVPLGGRVTASFGRRVVEQGSPLWDVRFRGDIAPALLTGVGAHAIAPARSLTPAGVGLFLAALAHTVGWPIPKGGSQVIAEAIATEFRGLGGGIITGQRVGTLAELPPHRAVLLNLSPAEVLRVTGRDLPGRYARWLRAYRYGGAACKADFALAGPVPWSAPGCDRAGTVHLVGTRAEALAAERDVAAGRHAERPYVLAVQPGVVDPDRAPAGKHVLYAYAHVPNGSPADMSEATITQVERFAPGFRDLILARSVITAAEIEKHNANYVGGDIAAGAMTLWQALFRPVPRWDPYVTPLPGVYLCSAATPPGPGVHGMAGVHAARRVLRREFGIRTDPLELLAQWDAARANCNPGKPGMSRFARRDP